MVGTVLAAVALYGLVRTCLAIDWFGGLPRWFLMGAAACAALQIIFPQNLTMYLFEHELTHLLCAKLFGARFHSMYFSSKRGAFVSVDKSNAIVALAPYFFPLYAMITLGLLFLVREPLRPFFAALTGAAFYFHISMTVHMMASGQSDIRPYGTAPVIVLVAAVNAVFLGSMIGLLSRNEDILMMGRILFT